MPSLCESGETEEAEWEEAAGDYVFRIVNNAIADREGKALSENMYLNQDNTNTQLMYFFGIVKQIFPYFPQLVMFHYLSFVCQLHLITIHTF